MICGFGGAPPVGVAIVYSSECERDLVRFGIFRETPVNELRSVTRRDGSGDAGFVETLEIESDTVFGVDGGEQESVDVGHGGLGSTGIGRQFVADRAGGADDPSGQDSAMGLPVV